MSNVIDQEENITSEVKNQNGRAVHQLKQDGRNFQQTFQDGRNVQQTLQDSQIVKESDLANSAGSLSKKFILIYIFKYFCLFV